MYEKVMQVLGMGQGLDAATDPGRSGVDRVVGGAEVLGSGLTMAGTAATGATVGGLGSCSMSTIGSLIAGGGVAGAGTAALAAGGVLGAGAGGYAIGSALDGLVGRGVRQFTGDTREVASRGVGGGTHEVADERDLSELMADGLQTETGDEIALAMADYMPTWLGGNW